MPRRYPTPNERAALATLARSRGSVVVPTHGSMPFAVLRLVAQGLAVVRVDANGRTRASLTKKARERIERSRVDVLRRAGVEEKNHA